MCERARKMTLKGTRCSYVIPRYYAGCFVCNNLCGITLAISNTTVGTVDRFAKSCSTDWFLDLLKSIHGSICSHSELVKQSSHSVAFTLLTPLVSALHVVGRLCRRRLLVGWLIWLVKGTQTRWLCKFSHVTKLIRDEGSVFGLSDHLHSQIFCSFYCYATEASPEMTLEDYSVILEGTATDQAAILDMWERHDHMRSIPDEDVISKRCSNHCSSKY